MRGEGRRGDKPRDGVPAGEARRPSAPELPEEIKATDLHSDVRADLLSLARPVADTVARHLVATGLLIDEDPAAALAHAMAARRLAPRIAAVREASGLAAYHAADWQTAIAELRTYHRLTGRQTHLAILADCERALGRPERAIDLFRSADRSRLDPTEAIELLIVAAGARGDLGQHAAAVAMLQVPELSASGPRPAVARLRYAFADALLSVGRREEAREWFSRAVEADEEATTDAAERLLELDGVLLSGDEDGEFVDGDGTGETAKTDDESGETGGRGETAGTGDETDEIDGTGETAGTGDETDEIDGTGETDETGDDGTDEDDEDGFADEDATDDEDGFADDGGFAEQDTDTDDDSFGARQAEDGLDEDSEDDDRDTDAVVEDREHDIPGSTRPQPDA